MWRVTAQARILIADDEAPVRELLSVYLGKEGFALLEAEDGLDALSLLRRDRADVALIDVMMPGLDGFEIVRRIRQESAIPIILLTARGEETSRVAGLEVGADDYVVKPFSAPEVVARVRAQLRRLRDLYVPQQLSVGVVDLDLVARRCAVNGKEIELTRREFDLLVAFVRRPQHVLTRDQLLEEVWETPYLSRKTVDVHVARLRRKLGDTMTVGTLRGVGYRFEP